ncbi:hypothetical protein [Pseudoalteromonas denitrificans]|uniref:DUF2845 domain-containing protein n=1 Tax=Pseudoalteromonas denitrificans DSM 6059 TaxID=1123010 RepID=A0A1I1V563_9GAMM|nr:hypothetical protein [Pseudoalteromonas denitrificans]SFD78146.1 hypothetical protein SAMN02745724_05429 [Pseudoalteromonas denitrificans DSM 6059]
MRYFKVLLILSFVLFSINTHARGSFRLDSGNLLTVGKSKSEIISIAGAPLYQDVEKIAVDNGQGGHSVKREILTYRLKGSIGGFYLVVMTIENSHVTSITSKQEKRL